MRIISLFLIQRICVTVAHRTLTPFAGVRIPHPLPIKKTTPLVWSFLLAEDEIGFERAAPVRTLVQKLRAGEQFLARGRIHRLMNASGRDVGISLFFVVKEYIGWCGFSFCHRMGIRTISYSPSQPTKESPQRDRWGLCVFYIGFSVYPWCEWRSAPPGSSRPHRRRWPATYLPNPWQPAPAPEA